MAMIDYGAIVRKDGVFINKDTDLFQKNIGDFPCEEAYNPKSDEYVRIRGNYFAYVGDEECFLAFYKGHWIMISNREIVLEYWKGTPFISETYFPVKDGLPTLTISHLDPEWQVEDPPQWIKVPWKEYVKNNWSGRDEKNRYLPCTGEEKLNELQNGHKQYRWYLRIMKRIARERKRHSLYKERTYRFIAEWEWKGHQYEVIFGYGIDPSTEVWEDLKKSGAYNFTETEKNIINEWFCKE